jgi:hypothetical protein
MMQDKSVMQDDIQSIKDKMDSMNGFLLLLIKTETAHNDQHNVWMKQVRDIAQDRGAAALWAHGGLGRSSCRWFPSMDRLRVD